MEQKRRIIEHVTDKRDKDGDNGERERVLSSRVRLSGIDLWLKVRDPHPIKSFWNLDPRSLQSTSTTCTYCTVRTVIVICTVVCT